MIRDGSITFNDDTVEDSGSPPQKEGNVPVLSMLLVVRDMNKLHSIQDPELGVVNIGQWKLLSRKAEECVFACVRDCVMKASDFQGVVNS